MSISEQKLILQPGEGLVGKSVLRVDSHLKVTGRAAYARDMKLARMLHAQIKRCPYPHARILSIDTSAARDIPGVRAIITGSDFPPLPTEDTPALARDEVLYCNQGVVAVAAETRTAAEEAVERIKVEYERLPAVFDPELAMSEETPTIIRHPSGTSGRVNVGRYLRVRRGRVEEAFEKADLIVENTYATSGESHFQLEPLTFLAQPDADGGVTLWTTSSGPHKTQLEAAQYLGLDTYLVRVRVSYLGGWFGSKEESHVAAVCAKLALESLRPVKLELSREETMTASGIRHPARIYVKDGVTGNGKIIAREIRAVYDGGAYSSLGNDVLRNSVFAVVSVYDIPNLKFDAYRVYTNRVPGTPKRGPIGMQIVWAVECQMDYIAFKLGIDPVELRLRNTMKEGSVNAIGEVMEGISHDLCVRKVADAIKLNVKEKPIGPAWRRGKGVSLGAKWGAGGLHRAMVRVRENGKVEVWAEVVENGQGSYTGIMQIAATEFGISLNDVLFAPLIRGVESDTSEPAGGASASRQIVNVGKAVVLACREAKKRVAESASKILQVSPYDIDVRGGRVYPQSDPSRAIKMSELFTRGAVLGGKLTVGSFLEGGEFIGYGTVYKKSSEMDPETGVCKGGRAVPYYVSVSQAADVSVNVETGQIRVHKIAAAIDAGKAINPQLVDYQTMGSVLMGLSGALSEELIISDGRVTNTSLADYKILTGVDAPEIEPIIVESAYEAGPYGAKGVGEPSLLPTAAAVRNAIHDAVGVWINDLPITPEKVLEALSKRG